MSLLLLTLVEVNVGYFGEGRVVSLPSMETTVNMVGRSLACSCTHKSPIRMHFKTSLAGYVSVRTYVIHLLGTYVILLCNWLIL